MQRRSSPTRRQSDPEFPTIDSPIAEYGVCLGTARARISADWPLATHDERMREAASLLGYQLAPLP
jgi:hypothetical protein